MKDMCETNIKPEKQILIGFGRLDEDLAMAIPALVSVRKQCKSVVVKSLLREALRSVPDLPNDIKKQIA
tara:strand:- start:451 stop:657 length:207 start_codon:yes stop_codon:yes gene_type:complete